MKTVEDAVRQEDGVWAYCVYNAMAYRGDLIDYWVCDADGDLRSGTVYNAGILAPEGWQLVCTREEFEEKAKEMGYGVDDSEDDYIGCQEDDHAVQSSELQQASILLLLAYLQGQADAGIESAQMAHDFWRDLNNKGA